MDNQQPDAPESPETAAVSASDSACIDKRAELKVDRLFVYTSLVSLGGVILFIGGFVQASDIFPQAWLLFGVAAIAELINVEGLVPQLSFSISSAVFFATMLIFGPWAGALAGAVGGAVATIMREIADHDCDRKRAPFLQRFFFNMASLGIALFLAGQIYLLFKGEVGEVQRVSNIPPLLIAAIVMDFANAFIILGAISLQTHTPLLAIWSDSVSWAVPISILSTALGGGGMALGYEIAGAVGLAVYFLPVALTIYAFRLYVDRTKELIAQQEATIEDRTRELKTANEELRHLDRIKTTFFSMVNHEMRSPLTSIIGYTHLLAKKLENDELEKLDAIERNSERLIEMVNSILDISSLEEGELKVHPEAMHLETAVQDAVSSVAPAAQEKYIEIDVDLPALPQIQGEYRRVVQILINLLSNSVKYTPETGYIRISARRLSDDTGEKVAVSVADTGMGIPEELLPHLFDRFTRAELAEKSNIVGTGLGLTITRGLVEAHGGEIWVESREGEGATFTFTLPIAT
jgi:signal transduction histidine kinase